MKSSSRTRFQLIEVLLTGIIISLLGLLSWYVYRASKPPLSTAQPTNTSDARFTGTVTENGCAAQKIPVGDVGCSIRIGIAQIAIVHGTMQTDQWGSLIDVKDITQLMGKKVEVYVHRLATNSYTLAGSSSYYLKELQ